MKPEAVEWFRKSAEQGHEWAQYLLGYMYENKKTLKKPSWYRKAAEQGDEFAQEALERLGK